MNLLKKFRSALDTPTITHSLDGSLYYIEYGDRRPRHWLSVEVTPGPVPEDKKHGALDGYMQVNKTNGEVYHRKTLPFAFWDVKTAHDTAPIDKKSDLFLDYAAFERWEI